MDFFRKLFGSSNKKKSEPSAPRPKFVPPPPPEPPKNGIVTIEYVRQMLDEIRKNPQHTHRPRWAHVFDYFYYEASPDERQELINTVSNDKILCKQSAHVWRQEVINRHKIDPLVYLRRSFVSIILDNGHGQPTPCELPRTIQQERRTAKIKGLEEEFNNLMEKLPPMATPRIAQIFQTGFTDASAFKDVGIKHCDDIPPEYFENIEDSAVKKLFEPLQIAYRKADDWLRLADFWREEATPEQRYAITTVIRANKLYHVAKYSSDFYLITQDPARFVEFSLTITAMQDAAPDWREEPMRLSKTLSIARDNTIDIKPIIQKLHALSEENAQRVFDSL